MRYLTNEWYALCQKTGLHFGLRAHKAADTLNETLYERLKQKKLKALIELQCEKDFERFHQCQIVECQRRLPQGLLEQIADIRLFALGYCTKEIRQTLKRLSEKNRKQVEMTLSDYQAVQMKQDLPEVLKTQLNWHDSQITAIEIAQDIQLTLKDFSEEGQTHQILFRNAKVIKQETSLIGSYWLYKEIYLSNGGYEIHVLVSDSLRLSAELTLWCEGVEVV